MGIVKEVDVHCIFTITVKVNVSELKGASGCEMVKRRLFEPLKETSEVESVSEACSVTAYTLRDPATSDIKGDVNVNSVGKGVESAFVKVVLY